MIATAAAALSNELFGFEARWAWTLLFGAFALALGLLGPIGVVRTFVRRSRVWVVPVTLALPRLVGAQRRRAQRRLARRRARAVSAPGRRSTSSSAVTVSWVPLAADYTRFARTPRGAFWGPGSGTSFRTRSSSRSAR